MAVSTENYNIISSDSAQDKTELESMWRISTISALTLQKIKLDNNQYGELQQYQIKLNGSQCEKLEQCQF